MLPARRDRPLALRPSVRRLRELAHPLKNLFLTLVLLGLITPAAAGTLADIQVRVELPGGKLVLPGDVTRLILTITNNGPDAAIGARRNRKDFHLNGRY